MTVSIGHWWEGSEALGWFRREGLESKVRGTVAGGGGKDRICGGCSSGGEGVR